MKRAQDVKCELSSINLNGLVKLLTSKVHILFVAKTTSKIELCAHGFNKMTSSYDWYQLHFTGRTTSSEFVAFCYAFNYSSSYFHHSSAIFFSFLSTNSSIHFDEMCVVLFFFLCVLLWVTDSRTSHHYYRFLPYINERR